MRIVTTAAALCAILATTAASWAAAPTLRDWADFDRSYIPALALTSQGDAAGARQATSALAGRWKAFAAAFATARPADPSWAKDFAAIGESVARGESLAAKGGQLPAAHEALEGIRTTLLALRRRNSVDYYVDYLTAYHGPMEAIVTAVKGKTAATLTDAEVAALTGLLAKARASWGDVARAKLDPEVFGFGPEQVSLAQGLAADETIALATLRTSLAGKDKGAIIRAAEGLKGPFSKLFMMFGDFPKKP